MYIPTKKPCTQDHILHTGLSHFKGSLRKNVFEARWNMALRAVKVSALHHSSVEASIHEQYTGYVLLHEEIFCTLAVLL